MDKSITHTTIIKVLSISLIIFCIISQLISMDFVHSLPYLVIGIILAIISYTSAHKIKLFSPVYTAFITMFFCYVFSSFYYFFYETDVMENVAIIGKDILNDINLIYFLFVLIVLIPIVFLMYGRKKSVKFKYFSENFAWSSINNKITICNIIFFISIIAALGYSGMSLIDAFFSSVEFRHAISNGPVAIVQMLIMLAVKFTYIIVLKDTFAKTNKISVLNKTILIIELLVWSLICGSKGVLVFLVIFNFMFLFTLYRKIKLKHLLIIGIGIVFILTYSSVINKFRTDGLNMVMNNDYESLKDIKLLRTLASRNDNFANSIQMFKYINSRDDLLFFDDFHIKDELTIHFIKFLPRSIRNNIKQGDCDLYSTEMTKLLYPEIIERQSATFEFGVVANLFWCLGIIGVLLGGFLIGIYVAITQAFFDRYKYCDVFLEFYLCILASICSGSFMVGIINSPGIMGLTYTLPLVIIMCLLFKKSFKLKIANKTIII